MPKTAYQIAANMIFAANKTGDFCAPVRGLIGDSVDAGYEVQTLNRQRWHREGRVMVGHKIGLTSVAVQTQLGVGQPDFGVLYKDMEIANGAIIPVKSMHQPKAEVEIALILKSDIGTRNVTRTELIQAIDYIAPAIEIVGSRIQKWDIGISDTIADNASSGLYVLGQPVRNFQNIDLRTVEAKLFRNGHLVSSGKGSDCLDNPLNAALWLAEMNASRGEVLRAGDIILTGAMGPMIEISAGDMFEATISNIGSIHFSVEKQVSNKGDNDR